METDGGRHLVINSWPACTHIYIHMDHTHNKDMIWGSLIIVVNYPENAQI